MKILFFISLLVFVLSDGCESTGPKTFQNYKILSVRFENQDQIKKFEKLFSLDPVDVIYSN